MAADEIQALKEDIEKISNLSLKYIGMSESDIEILHGVADHVLAKKQEILNNVLNSLLGDPDARKVVEMTGLQAERAAKLLELWLTNVFKGNYDLTHALTLFRIGLAHVRSGVDERLMINNMGGLRP